MNLKMDSDLFSNGIRSLLFFGLLVVAVGCIDHAVALPEGYLTQEEMIPIMVDIHLVEGARSGKLVLGDTNDLSDYYARIYQKYGISEKEFKESFYWYTQHPEELNKVYEASIEQLSILEAEIKANARKPVRKSE